MWTKTKFTKLLGIDLPIIQGPFGGKLSSVELTAVVSNTVGLDHMVPSLTVPARLSKFQRISEKELQNRLISTYGSVTGMRQQMILISILFRKSLQFFSLTSKSWE